MTNTFTCPFCGKTSPDSSNVEHAYCGACHRFVTVDDAVALLATERNMWARIELVRAQLERMHAEHAAQKVAANRAIAMLLRTKLVNSAGLARRLGMQRQSVEYRAGRAR